ncbi:hypothetical protein F511_41487 [Dorcoceras hygrometricum]|uniref:Uncharacterized protein n=1 Tax=Dorcoceras hygrometricum TaxID=472368 RepID=A0A2Z7C9B1_9LAMI|nr:hypothetical protein F511_41487 [Dorcoceras hygrometricum]
MMRRRAGDSADEIVLMMSSVTSSYSADGLRDQSQESAVASYSAISRCYLKIVIAKRCRLHKFIRQRFALALKIQQEDFALFISAVEATVDPVATQRFPVAVFWSNQTQEDESIVVEEDSGEAFDQPDASNSSIHVQSQEIQAQRIEEVAKRSSRSVKSAAKQLTIYESWMSTAELNSNGESDKKPAKEKDAIASYSAISRCYLKIVIAKRCRLHKFIRQRFALALKIQQEDFALFISAVEATVDPVATQRFPVAVFWSNQTQEDESIVVEEDSGEAFDQPDASNSSIHVQSQEIQAQRIEEVAKRSSRSVKSAAKQLTIYESWMSTAELNSNGESDKKPAKEKDAISHTVEAVVHLWSLGVLTAVGCGIGSVHVVVRSNLLVEPSEVEEGEM